MGISISTQPEEDLPTQSQEILTIKAETRTEAKVRVEAGAEVYLNPNQNS